ncbi:hypothetical protein NMY22_g17574 [Coprinellus aureogranulatus]|nr:hypothetical protein NMY22_g17574 [Coprinellus aureogranulatus]
MPVLAECPTPVWSTSAVTWVHCAFAPAVNLARLIGSIADVPDCVLPLDVRLILRLVYSRLAFHSTCAGLASLAAAVQPVLDLVIRDNISAGRGRRCYPSDCLMAPFAWCLNPAASTAHCQYHALPLTCKAPSTRRLRYGRICTSRGSRPFNDSYASGAVHPTMPALQIAAAMGKEQDGILAQIVRELPKDPFRRCEVYGQMSSRYLVHLFDCPTRLPKKHARGIDIRLHNLSNFIWYLFYRTDLPTAVIFSSLILVHRVKCIVEPHDRNDLCVVGHRIILSTTMLAAKYLMERTYDNQSWRLASGQLFPLKEVNKMERDMCELLDWDLTIDKQMLEDFALHFMHDFRKKRRSYPIYPLFMCRSRAQSSSPRAPQATTSKRKRSPSDAGIVRSAPSRESTLPFSSCSLSLSANDGLCEIVHPSTLGTSADNIEVPSVILANHEGHCDPYGPLDAFITACIATGTLDTTSPQQPHFLPPFNLVDDAPPTNVHVEFDQSWLDYGEDSSTPSHTLDCSASVYSFTLDDFGSNLYRSSLYPLRGPAQLDSLPFEVSSPDFYVCGSNAASSPLAAPMNSSRPSLISPPLTSPLHSLASSPSDGYCLNVAFDSASEESPSGPAPTPSPAIVSPPYLTDRVRELRELEARCALLRNELAAAC